MLSIRITLAGIVAMASLSTAQEWPGFRGPNRDGVAAHGNPPLVWSDTDNLAWKTALPGGGSSSPVVAGDKVFVTSYSGYGIDPDEPGNPEDLTRRLICLSRATGEILWDRAVPSTAAEVGFHTQASQHGYATPTPVVHDDRVYVYFGRTGVLAFDLEGEPVWTKNVGTGVEPAPRQSGNRRGYPSGRSRGERRGNVGARGASGRGSGGFGGGGPMVWGSVASPLIAGDLLIVYAADTSNSLLALSVETGEEIWKVESEKLANETSSPLLVLTADGGGELVLAVTGEIWGLDPATGERKWTVENGGRGMQIATPVADRDHVFVLGGMGIGTTAIRTGSLENESDRVAWQNRQSGGMPSPALHDGVLYVVDSRGILLRMDAQTGEVTDRGEASERVTGGVYASPVVADGRVYVLGREGKTNVYSADGELKLLASNQLGADDSRFNASPAFAGDQIFLRSDKFIYCITAQD